MLPMSELWNITVATDFYQLALLSISGSKIKQI